MNLTKSFKIAVVALSISALPVLSYADVCDVNDLLNYDPVQCANGGGSGQPGGGNGSNAAAVPIDGGASFLALAGAGIGIKKYLKNRKNKSV